VYCPYCKTRSVILDVERGEYVCTRCGTVIDVLYLPSRSQLDNEPITPTVDEVSLDVNIQDLPLRERRKLYMGKLKILDQNVKSRLRVEKKAVTCLKIVAHRLGLSDRHVEIAIEVLRKLLKKYGSDIDKRDISSYKIAAAAVLYAVLIHNLPISPKDIVEHFQKIGHKVSSSEIFRILIEGFGKIVNTTTDRVKTYVEYIVSRLSLEDCVKMELLKNCHKIMSKILNRKIYGKSPRTIAAAIILLAAKRSKIPVTPVDVATILNVSPITLREHVRKLERLLKE